MTPTQISRARIIRRRTSQKQFKTETYLQWNTNKNLHMPYLTVKFRMILSNLSKFQQHEASRGVSARFL